MPSILLMRMNDTDEMLVMPGIICIFCINLEIGVDTPNFMP